ncbi:hypothetical protein [Wenyingzhuangia sp. IMCC45574]
MRYKFITLGLSILFWTHLTAQKNESFNTNIHDSYNIIFGVPLKITKNYTFYNKNNTEYQKSIITYSKKLDTISEKRYKNGEFNAELVFIYNKNRNLIYRSFKNKNSISGWRYKSTKYKYDNTGRIETRTMDQNRNLIDLEIIENDSLKNKTLSKLYNSKNQLVGYETTDYFYTENKKVWKVYNGTGKMINQSTTQIIKNKISEKSITNKYNDFGDCILYPRNWNENDNVFYQVEYKYDKLGNWVEKKTFTLNKINGELKNRKIYKKFKRKIKYRK